MSFRWNLSRDLSDRSFYAEGNELVATSIGLTANRTAISCRLNVNQKDYRIGKSYEDIIGLLILVGKKHKREAFRQLQKFTHYHRTYGKQTFLP